MPEGRPAAARHPGTSGRVLEELVDSREVRSSDAIPWTLRSAESGTGSAGMLKRQGGSGPRWTWMRQADQRNKRLYERHGFRAEDAGSLGSRRLGGSSGWG